MTKFTTTQHLKDSYDCLCLGIYSDQLLNPFTEDPELAKLLSVANVKQLIEQGDFTGSLGSTYVIALQDNKIVARILLLGLGDSDKLSKKNYDKALDSLITALKSLTIKHLGVLLLPIDEGLGLEYHLQRLSFTWQRQGYQFNEQAKAKGIAPYTHTKPSKDNSSTLENMSCFIPTDMTLEQGNKALTLGACLATGVNTTRFLGDLPANVCTPSYLAQFAEQLASSFDNLQVRIKDEAAMQQLGMNVLLSVSQGSVQEAKLIEIEYTPKNPQSKDTLVLIGKGVTFDTGGISLKPSANMDEMKYDMCGGASVLGVMHFIAISGACNKRVIAIIPTVENMPSHKATKPGDVFVSYSGQTVEVLNTDAEGRLILADTLSYAEEIYQPTKMINVATLTGACVIALGNHRSAVMSNDDSFADELVAIGQSVLDPCWQLPLDDEYDELLHSNFADMANIGGRAAGSITAGCFLKRFIKNTAWAHLDIAGVAWLEGKKKGATGRPVPLLAHWVMQQ